MKEQILEIQTGRTGLQKKIEAVQTDSGRVLKCIVTDMQIPPGATAKIYAIKPSGAEIYNNCVVSGLAIVVDLTTQMLADIGVTYCQVQVMSAGKTVTSFEFSVDVKRSLISSSAIESTNEFTALETAIWQAQQLYSPKFTEATNRVNISSGETVPILFGKIKKWFADLGSAAFSNIVNNATTTIANTVLDGRMGKILMDRIDELNRNMQVKIYANSYTPNGVTVTATIQGNVASIRLTGRSTALATSNAYAAMGTISELLPLMPNHKQIIEYNMLCPGIYGQLVIDTAGVVKIGYTIDGYGTPINLPETDFYKDITFVLA